MTGSVALDTIIKYYEDDNIKSLFNGELDVINRELKKVELIEKQINDKLKLIEKKIYVAEMNGISTSSLQHIRFHLLDLKNTLMEE